MEIKVEESDLFCTLKILGQIPEFDILKESWNYQECLFNKKNLILVAKVDDRIVGCKVAMIAMRMGLFTVGSVVLPEFRKLGVLNHWLIIRRNGLEKKASNQFVLKLRINTKACFILP